MKKNVLIVILILLVSSIAYGKFGTIMISVTDDPGHGPATAGNYGFDTWVEDRTSDKQTHADNGCFTEYVGEYSSWFVVFEMDNFNATWVDGEDLTVRVWVNDGVYANDYWQEKTFELDNTKNPQLYTPNGTETEALGTGITLISQPTPLAVTLSSFTAVYTGEVPVLQWTTLSEHNNIGWNVYRGESEDYSMSLMVNSELVSGAGTTTDETNYEFYDQYEVISDNTYWYWLESIESGGLSEIFNPISLYIPEDGNDETPPVEIPMGLHGNYPNPFNPSTTISFALEDAGPYSLEIFNIKGQKVHTHRGEITSQNAGSEIHYIWERDDNQRNGSASSVYFYRLKTDSQTYTKKMILIK